MPPGRTTHRRRVFIPLVILAVAAAVWIITARQQKPQVEAVRQIVHRLCVDVAAGREQNNAVIQANRSLAGQVAVAELRELLADRSDVMDSVSIDVTSGDHPDFSNAPLHATHTAMIGIGDSDALGLRVLHRDGAKDIVILGYWRPEAE